MPSGAVIASSQAEVGHDTKSANVTMQSVQSNEANRTGTNFKRMKNGGIFGSPQNTDEKVWNLHYVYTNPRIGGGESQTTSIRLTQKGNASTL